MKTKIIVFLLFFSMLVPVLIVFSEKEGTAMPGFARKYRFTCQTCHAPFPKLKPYGEEFAANGFKLPEGEPPYSTIDTGDDMLDLVRDFPIGIRMDVYGSADTEDDINNDIEAPYLLKLISGGPVTENLAYYFYFFFSERGEVAGVEDAFLYYKDIFNTGINITAGQFAVSDPVYKNELRLTFEGYVPFGIKPPRSLADLKYARGIVVDYGFDFGLDLVGQVVNGNGIDPADGDTHKFDGDKYKNSMFRISQGLLEVVRLGGFVYIGREKNTPDEASDIEKINDIRYYGADASLYAGPFELNLLYMYREDSNGYFYPEKQSIQSNGYMAELQFHPDGDRSIYVITALYNRFDSDYEDSLGVNSLDYESATLSLTYLLARNARITGEYTYLIRDLSLGEDYENHHEIKAGLTVAL